MTDSICPTRYFEYHQLKMNMIVLSLKLLLNSAVGLDRSPAPACFAHTGRDTYPASLAPLALLPLKFY